MASEGHSSSDDEYTCETDIPLLWKELTTTTEKCGENYLCNRAKIQETDVKVMVLEQNERGHCREIANLISKLEMHIESTNAAREKWGQSTFNLVGRIKVLEKQQEGMNILLALLKEQAADALRIVYQKPEPKEVHVFIHDKKSEATPPERPQKSVYHSTE